MTRTTIQARTHAEAELLSDILDAARALRRTIDEMTRATENLTKNLDAGWAPIHGVGSTAEAIAEHRATLAAHFRAAGRTTGADPHLGELINQVIANSPNVRIELADEATA